MKLLNIKDYKGGWLVGSFRPAILQKQDIEVGLKYYPKNMSELKHVHNIVTEYTIIVQGKVSMNNTVYETGDIIQIDPTESTDFIALEDTITCVIKTPSLPSDKYFV